MSLEVFSLPFFGVLEFSEHSPQNVVLLLKIFVKSVEPSLKGAIIPTQLHIMGLRGGKIHHKPGRKLPPPLLLFLLLLTLNGVGRSFQDLIPNLGILHLRVPASPLKGDYRRLLHQTSLPEEVLTINGPKGLVAFPSQFLDPVFLMFGISVELYVVWAVS